MGIERFVSPLAFHAKGGSEDTWNRLDKPIPSKEKMNLIVREYYDKGFIGDKNEREKIIHNMLDMARDFVGCEVDVAYGGGDNWITAEVEDVVEDGNFVILRSRNDGSEKKLPRMRVLDFIESLAHKFPEHLYSHDEADSDQSL
jgi:hypothetical protein